MDVAHEFSIGLSLRVLGHRPHKSKFFIMQVVAKSCYTARVCFVCFPCSPSLLQPMSQFTPFDIGQIKAHLSDEKQLRLCSLGCM